MDKLYRFILSLFFLYVNIYTITKKFEDCVGVIESFVLID